jgi:hypothetical protein
MNNLNKQFLSFLNKDENLKLFFLSLTLIIIIIYLNIPSGGMTAINNLNKIFIVDQLYPLGGNLYLYIVTI